MFYTGEDFSHFGDLIYNTLIKHCDAIRQLDGVDSLFNPCTTAVVSERDIDGGKSGSTKLEHSAFSGVTDAVFFPLRWSA